ncbi:MAG: M13 family metallopeptidase, partial [Tidjanibacter sp.]|nr:M13 family metallopeptidase [Tidjanibacter sp.]
MITLFSVAALASCCGDKKTPAIDTANFDESYALQDDFYEHFTAGWQRNHPMKPEYSRYGAFDMLRESNELRIKELFAELQTKGTEEGSVEQKIADLYRMGLDSAKLNADGAEPLKAALQTIEAVDSRSELSALLGQLHRTSGNPFFYAMVSADEMNTSANVLYLGQAGLGLGDRDYYFDESGEAIRTAYVAYIRRVMLLAGYAEEEAARIAESVMAIENALAESHYTNVELRNPHKNYNRLTSAALRRAYRNIDWSAYTAALGLQLPEELVVAQKPALARANKLIGSAPLRTIKDYLLFHEVRGAASYLSDDFAEATFDFYGRTLSGQQEQRPRWKRSLGAANSLLSEAVGEIYVAKYFPAEYKEKMLTIVGNLQEALSQHINALEWMSEATKVKAQEKLATFTVKIGYPDKWKDYTSLIIDPTKSYYENIKAANEWYTADNLSELGQPVD